MDLSRQANVTHFKLPDERQPVMTLPAFPQVLTSFFRVVLERLTAGCERAREPEALLFLLCSVSSGSVSVPTHTTTVILSRGLNSPG